MAAFKQRPPDSSCFVSSKVTKFVTLCDVDHIGDDLYDIDDNNILGYLTDEEDTDYADQETFDEDDCLELHLIPCKTVCS